MARPLILGLLLLFAVAIVAVACGGEETATTAVPTDSAAASTEATSASTEATSAPTETTTLPAVEPIVFKMATPSQEDETGGKIARHFIDLVEEKTGGSVTFELSAGGTIGTPSEMLGLASSGVVDIVLLLHAAATTDLPLLDFPPWAPGSRQDAIDYCSFLVFDNPQTAALIQAEAEAANVKYLGFTAGGSDCFVSKTAFATLADLKGKKCAVGGMIPAFQAIGLEPVQSFPADIYDSLSGGVADCAQMGFTSTVQLKWYEVAPYYMFDGTYAAGNPWTVNLDSWAKLSPEQQQAFMHAAAELEAWSVQLVADDEAAALETIKGAGVTVADLTVEDQKMWWDALFAAGAADCWQRAADGDFTDAEAKVLAAAAEFTGTTWTPPAP